MNRTHLIVMAVTLLGGLAAGFFLRPVVIKRVDTQVEDSLRFEAQKWEGIAKDYEADADHHRARYDSLLKNPVVVTRRIPHVYRQVHSSGLDSIMLGLDSPPAE